MSQTHQPTDRGEWWLGRGVATQLAAAAEPRWLAVSAGRAWATRTGAGPFGEDVWLSEGDRLPLPPGSAWVVEAAPVARLMLLHTPQQRRGFSWGAWKRGA
jgi:hypothetical protein